MKNHFNKLPIVYDHSFLAQENTNQYSTQDSHNLNPQDSHQHHFPGYPCCCSDRCVYYLDDFERSGTSPGNLADDWILWSAGWFIEEDFWSFFDGNRRLSGSSGHAPELIENETLLLPLK